MFLSSFIVLSLIFSGASLPVESAALELRELTSSNFIDSVKNDVWFVEFFSPNCGHCRAFEPTWKRLAEYVDSQSDPGISLARVNCLAQGDLCGEQKIRGYPTLLIYEEGDKKKEFNEARDYDRLTRFIDVHARKLTPSPPPPPPPPPPPVHQNTLTADGKVLSLNYNSFHSAVEEGPIFVKFFAPWCGHCKKLAPTWIEFASEMEGKVTVAEVDCDEHKILCKMQGIRGYPTIFLYQHGQTIEFTGGRKLEALKSFAEAALAPPLSSVSYIDLEEAVEKHSVVYAVLHNTLADSIRDMVEEASQPLHGTPPILSIQVSSILLSSLDLPVNQPLPVLVCLKDHSMKTFNNLILSSASAKAEISDWLISHSLPSSTQLDADNFAKIMGSPSSSSRSISRLTVIAAINSQDVESVEQLQKIAKSWFQQNKSLDGKVAFTWMDRQKWDSWLKSTYGIKSGSGVAVILADHSQLLYYDTLPTGRSIELTHESIDEAIKAVHDGSLKAKHSENVFERFIRHLNNKTHDLGAAISEHPIRFVFFLCLVFVGIFFIIKRIVDNDAKRYASVYVAGGKGARLD